MQRILKYKLIVSDNQTIEIAGLDRILSVAEQRGEIVIYALTDTTQPVITTVIDVLIAGTGHGIIPSVEDKYETLDSYTFLGTVNLMNGELMFHVFYRKE